MTKELHKLTPKELQRDMDQSLDIIASNKRIKSYLLEQLSKLDKETWNNSVDYTVLKVIQMLREKKVIK